LPTLPSALCPRSTPIPRTQSFVALAKKDGDDIAKRDAEDGEKLAVGIKLAQEKGVLGTGEPAPYTQVDVLGKSADEVADEIITALGDDFKGGVLTLVGLSGTGKGTTVCILTLWAQAHVYIHTHVGTRAPRSSVLLGLKSLLCVSIHFCFIGRVCVSWFHKHPDRSSHVFSPR
jgi:hypothetical protein